MTELLVVIGIIAATCAIAIPSIFAIRDALRFATANNYAKSIFLAAQQNLTELRSDGGLAPVQSASGAYVIPDEVSSFPDEFRAEYVYTVTGTTAFERVLPAGSIDAELRNDQIVIEYNPQTGNVYSVFYYEKDTSSLNLAGKYADGELPREKEDRRKMAVGYYDGSGLNSTQIELEQTQAIVEFINGEEGIVQVKVPMPESFYGKFTEFAQGLNVMLTISGEWSMTQLDPAQPLTLQIKTAGNQDGCALDADGKTLVLTYVIDSLASRRSFVNYASGTQAVAAGGVANTAASLTTLLDEECFIYNILPGENITIQADVTYTGDGSELVQIDPGILSGVNPMFEYLQPIGDGSFVLAVSNGRNLQNLNAIAPTIADKVANVVFTSDIYWNDTVAYYNNTYAGGNTYFTGATVSGNHVFDEAPARALPYFVPIHNEKLFGTARFIFPGDGDGGLGDLINSILGALGYGRFNNSNVPTLTDEYDNRPGVSHASIQGDGHGVYNICIDSTKYQVPNEGKKTTVTVNGSTAEKDLTGTFYATGENQIVDYCFSGLFGYVNTPISDLRVVNPIVKGYELTKKDTTVPNYIFGFPFGTKTVSLYNNPATGALLGAGGYNTLITNCSTYIDKNAHGYMALSWGPHTYSANNAQNWYGVSGTGAVGGLVGYAKSHRSVTGELTNSAAHIAFSNCFAAVPVSGNMRTTSDKNFGYSNGVGAFIGNSQLTNFYNCYASGDVLASGCRVGDTKFGSVGNLIAGIFGIELDLPYDGRTSWGAGGFVGTSHGTRYTNCFSTGNITAGSNSRRLGAGGFVGFMSIDETKTYGNLNSEGKEEIAQRTVFTDCYSVGMATTNGAICENFSGANGRITLKFDTSLTYYVGDYFRLYAPHYVREGTAPDYEDFYIYRDTYFLSNYHTDETDQENSTHCASPDSYASFTDMVGNHTIGSKWMNDEIQEIKDIMLSRWLDTTYDTEYFQKRTELTGIYQNLYAAGYSAEYWNSATASTTHPYSLTDGSRYPFTKLKNMDYYGDWPSKPSDMGLAYFETYADTNNTHYFFDKNHTEYSSLALRDGTDVIVKDDGYSIFSANNTNLTVTVGGVTDTLTVSGETYTVSQKAYHVFHLSDKLMAELPEGDEFYVKVTAKHQDSADTYTMYFNPNVAISHVNPVENGKSAIKPDAAPTTIYIRSARQFKGIATLDHFWGSSYRYIQQLNIDASVYQWNNGVDGTKLSPIGTGADNNQFNASYSAGYTSLAGIKEQYKISGFEFADAGIFGIIGESGSVTDVIIECETFTAGSANETNVAVLAGINHGTITNVDLEIDGDVILTASSNTGLIAGLSSGKITDCDVNVKNITIKALNAGGMVGYVQGRADKVSTLNNSVLTVSGEMKVSGKTGNAGGMIGKATYLNSEKLFINLASLTGDAVYTGGLAGYVENSNFTGVVSNTAGANPVEVSVTKIASTNTEGYVAGVLGYAADTMLTAMDVTVQSVTGNTAAGFLGNSKNADATNCDVVVTGTVTGTAGAAGVAGIIGPQSVFSDVPVVLRGAKVQGGNAAGYALELKGDAYIMGNSHVTMGNSTANKTTISATGDAAGFVVTTVGSIGDSNVIGFGAISGEQAAGYAVTVTGNIANCHVSPALANNNYLGNANANLAVSGKSAAAGFAMTLNKDSTIANSYALCSITADGKVTVAATEGESTVEVSAVYGFVGTNNGTLNRCMANVDLTDGFAFVGVNDGLVTTSYGWYGDGERVNATTTRSEISGSGKCYNSYFADLAPVNRSDEVVVVYDSEGAVDHITPTALQILELAGFVTGYNEYPYQAMDASEADYPYPMLRDHYGNWITPPQYAYGVAYFEEYANSSRKIHMVDLSNSALTEEGQKNIKFPADTFEQSDEITKTGYAMFYNTQFGEKDGLDFQLEIDGFTFDFYIIESNDEYAVNAAKDGHKSAVVDCRFADAIVEGTAFPTDYVYKIRTAEQLANIALKSSANFKQDRNLVIDGFTTIENFSGSYNGNELQLTVANGNTWITTLSGAVNNLNLTVEGAANESVFGSVSGTLTLKVVQIGSIAENGALVGASSGAITTGDITTGEIAQNSKLFGDITAGDVNGAVFGTVSGGTVESGAIAVNNVNGAVFGAVSGGTVKPGAITTGQIGTAEKAASIFGDITNGAVVNSGAITTGDKAVYGQVFGNVGAPVTVNNIQIGALTGQVFGTVSADVTVTNGITVGDVNGTVFAAVSGGTVKPGAITTGQVGTADKNASIFGDITGGTVTAGAISTNDKDVYGNVFGNVSGTVSVNNIHVGNLKGQVFGAVNGIVSVTDATNATNDITVADVSGCNANWLVASVSGGTVTLGDVQAANAVTTVTEETDESGNAITVTTVVYNPVSAMIGKIEGGKLAIGNVTVGNVSNQSNWLIASVTNATVTVGNVTVNNSTTTVRGSAEPDVNYDAVSNMVGAISGGSVTGGAVELGGANINGNLFTGVTNATLQNFAVNTTGTMGASLIGDVSAAESSTATINNVKVTAKGAAAMANSGLLVKSIDARTTVSNCNVEVSEAVTVSGIFGGITAEVPAGAALTNNTVNVKLNVTGAANTVIGGMVGKNSGTVSVSDQSVVVITYNQAAEDSATIGGLIGQMNGGSLTGTAGNVSATGAIKLAGMASARYKVGGAVGEDSGMLNDTVVVAKYANVITNVHVNDNWAVASTVSHSMPAGKGAIGKFVGYVNNGEFTSCEANNKNGTYMFLGEIKVTPSSLTGTNWYSHTSNNGPATVYGDKNVEAPAYDKYVKLNDGHAYYDYSAVLTDCAFLFTDGNTYYQQINPTEYFYNGTAEKAFFYIAGNQVGKLNATNHTPTFNNIHRYSTSWGANNKNISIPYYVLNNGVYYKATVTVDRENIAGKYERPVYEYTYQFKNLDGNVIQTLTVHQDNLNTAIQSGILYTLNVEFNSDSKLYIIADSTGKKAFAIDANGNAVSVDFTSGSFDSTNDLFASVWELEGAVLKNAKYTSSYLNMKGVLTAATGNDVQVDGNSLLGNNVSATVIPNFTLRCKDASYLTFSNSAFGMGGSGSPLSIFEVSQTNDFRMKASFAYQNLYNEICGAYDADGNTLAIAATLSLEEGGAIE